MKIKIDTDELVKNQVISQETADEIIQFHQSSQKTAIGKYALGIVAALFVLTGLSIFVNDIWSSVGLNTKILFSLMPILGGSLTCYAMVTRFPSMKILTESVAILQCVAIFATFIMLVESFHLSVYETAFILVVIILCFPFVIYFRATVAATLLILTATIAILCNNMQEVNHHLYVVLIGLMDGLFLYKTYFREKETSLLPVRLFLSSFVLIVFMIEFSLNMKQSPFSILPLIASSYIFTFRTWNRAKKWLEADDNWLELGAFLLSFYILYYCCSHHYSLYNHRTEALTVIPFALPLILIGILQFRNGIKMDFRQIHTLLAATIIALTPFMMGEDNNIVYILVMLLFLGYHTYLRIRHFNILFFSVVMICWMITSASLKHMDGFRPWVVAVTVLFLGTLLIGRQLLHHKKDKER